MTSLTPRDWVPAESDRLVQDIAARVAVSTTAATEAELMRLVEFNRQIHDRICVNLDPAANTMNPRAEAMLARGLGTRPSLGYPGAKYETGLEAIEQIEVIAAELAAETFGAPFAEIRVGSGAMANLYTFMAAARPGDAIIVPPATIGGHVTHHRAGAAGLYGLEIHEAPVDAANYTVDVEALADLAEQVQPRLISIGGSLNLTHHPVAEIRAIADAIGAVVLFDAAHLSGPIAGGAWPNPLAEGAHVMTMSTYKSLGGPPSGLLVASDAGLAERIDRIAFPGLTANFDVSMAAALVVTLLDWREFGADYAAEMLATARTLAAVLDEHDVPVHMTPVGATQSHAFAVDAGSHGGDPRVRHLRGANVLTSAIGLPYDDAAGLRIGTNEIVRWGITSEHAPELGALIARAWHAKENSAVADDVAAFRGRFQELQYVR